MILQLPVGGSARPSCGFPFGNVTEVGDESAVGEAWGMFPVGT